MAVIIGIDPHKASHTAVAIGRDEQPLAEIKVRATCQQTDRLLAWAEPLGERTWAVESARGIRYLLSQQLVGAGEQVLDVPATLVSRVRVLSTGKSNKNDPNDALSVAIAALRSPGLRSVEPADHREVLRLLAKRNHEIGRLRNIVVSRLHAALVNLSPGGISKELNASDAVRLLNDFEPITAVEQTRYDLAHELLHDVERLDVQESHRRIKTAVKASGTSLTELYGVGPILACELIGYTGDVRRFTTRDQYASYAGVAPVERSSGGRIFFRLSRRGNRQLNHAIHMVAICQIRQTNSECRIYFEKKVAEGKTKREAIRSLKRRVSNAVYRQPSSTHRSKGPRGQAGTTHSLRDRLCTLAAGSSAKSLPDPTNSMHSSSDGVLTRRARNPSQLPS
jgi:transposase